MGLLNLIFKKKENDKLKQEKNTIDCESIDRGKSNLLFTKPELQRIITILIDLSRMFKDSVSLISVGGSRNVIMMNRLYSYVGMFCFLYEDFGYGNSEHFLDSKIKERYFLVKIVMADSIKKNKAIKDLSENWSDVLNTIYTIKLGNLSDAKEFNSKKDEIEFVTEAMERWSGKKCDLPPNITYNPYCITENKHMSEGHNIPDLRAVFAEELIPQLILAPSIGKNKAEVTRDYLLSMLESYRDNARFVPMCIVDNLCQQIGDIATRAGVTYPGFSNLKDYVLDKIYK